MHRICLMIGLAALAACTDPRLNAGISLGPNGLRVVPSVSGQVGGATISVSP
jgi:hypothetical protein